MYKVLYVPKLACNLFSVRAAVSKGDFISLVILDVGFETEMDISMEWEHALVDKLYQLDCKANVSEAATLVNAQKDNNFDV